MCTGFMEASFFGAAVAASARAPRLSKTRHAALSGLVPAKPAAVTEAATAAPKNEASRKPRTSEVFVIRIILLVVVLRKTLS